MCGSHIFLSTVSRKRGRLACASVVDPDPESDPVPATGVVVYTAEAYAVLECVQTTVQGPKLHLDLSGQQDPLLLLDVSTLQGQAAPGSSYL
jgi:hypothetical protein